MKTFKPMKLGLLTKHFENDGQCYFVVTMLAYFTLDDAPRMLTEVSMWEAAMEELGKQGILDEAMSKLRGEVLVNAVACPRGKSAQPGCEVRVKVGSVDKKLRVAGDRIWKGKTPSEPVPFEQMCLSWARAYGGEDYAPNPVGIGHPVAGDEAAPRQLPNIEHPDELIKSPDTVPKAPAGFDGYDIMSPQRQRKAGTYDDDWLERRSPGFPADFDWSFFNVAPDDQQIERYFVGDEAIVLENLHPTTPVIESRLPGIRARCFVTELADTSKLREVPTRLDTVRLFPHLRRGIAMFRAVAKVAEDDAADLGHLMIAAEALDTPKTLEHYQQAFDLRTASKNKAMALMRDFDLLPAGVTDGNPMPVDPASVEAPFDGLMAQHMQQFAQGQLDQAREQLATAGVDLDEYNVPKVVPTPKQDKVDLENLDEVIEAQRKDADDRRAAAEDKQKKLQAQARALCDEHGLDYDKILASAKRDAAGPPNFSADAELDRLRQQLILSRNAGMPLPTVEAQLADPELERKMRTAEYNLFETYRRTAHMRDTVAALDADASRAAREKLEADVQAGKSLDGIDLTGVDLSGVRLRNASLCKALMESVNLTGADLTGADLTGAVLARANLTDAKLCEATLLECNLGGAQLGGADFNKADLTKATMQRATLTGAKFGGARFYQTEMTEAVSAGADFSNIDGTGMMFVEVDLTDACFKGAKLKRCVFVQSKLPGVDFSGAELVQTSFVTVEGDGANFSQAKLPGLCLVQDCSFAKATFVGSELTRANFRGTVLRRADFSNASLDGADFSECDLRKATLAGATACAAMLIRTDLSEADLSKIDLMDALLSKSKVFGTNFRGANLFRSDFSKAQGDKATCFDDANKEFVLISPATSGSLSNLKKDSDVSR